MKTMKIVRIIIYLNRNLLKISPRKNRKWMKIKKNYLTNKMSNQKKFHHNNKTIFIIYWKLKMIFKRIKILLLQLKFLKEARNSMEESVLSQSKKITKNAKAKKSEDNAKVLYKSNNFLLIINESNIKTK